jgi:hypothetical protein
VPDPQHTAKRCYTASRACTGELIRSLRAGDALDVQAHAAWAALHHRQLQKEKTKEEERTLSRLCLAAHPATTRRIRHSQETGAWLTAMPNSLNNT